MKASEARKLAGKTEYIDYAMALVFKEIEAAARKGLATLNFVPSASLMVTETLKKEMMEILEGLGYSVSYSDGLMVIFWGKE